MNKYLRILILALAGVGGRVMAQADNNLDLSTRSVGTPPQHVTVNSVAQWMENPLDQTVQITVTNFCADTNACLSIDLGSTDLKFPGAGVDEVGNYIPTNYPPVTVHAILRRQYNLSISCPNTGANGSPLFGIYQDASGAYIKNDFVSPDAFVTLLTNSPTDLVSGYLWSNFTAMAQSAITNAYTNSSYTFAEAVVQTNLIEQMDSIISSGSIYDANRFAGVTLQSDTTALLAKNPQGQDAELLNRMLLRDAYQNSNYQLPLPNHYDDSGTAAITISVLPPPELRIKKYRPTPQYTVLLNNVGSSAGAINLQNPGTGFQSATNAIFEITKDKFAHFAQADGCDDATKAPGQGSWLQMGPGCTEDTNRISLEWHVSLGRTFDGLSAGQIAFRQPGLTPISYTPYSLFYNASLTNIFGQATIVTTNIPVSCVTNFFTGWVAPDTTANNVNVLLFTNLYGHINTAIENPSIYTDLPNFPCFEVGESLDWLQNYADSVVIPNSGVVVYLGFTNSITYPDMTRLYCVSNAMFISTNYDMELRQVRSCQTLVDITTPDTNTTVLSFYYSDQVGTNQDQYGVFTNFLGNPQPFVTWTIQNPNPAMANSLNIIETRNGTVTTQSLVKAISGANATWTLTLGTGSEQRVETRQVSLSGTPTPTNRVETDTVQYASATTPAYQCQETYHCYPWGWELTQTSIPNGVSPLVTAYEYYDDPSEQDYDYIYGLSGAWGYGKIKSIMYPDGYWEKRVYNSLNCYAEGLNRYNNQGAMWTGYCPGLLHYIFHPYLDGRNGGATSPDNASPFNSMFTIMGYGGGYNSAYYGYEDVQPGNRLATTWDGVEQMMINNQVDESWAAMIDLPWDTTTSASSSLVDDVDWQSWVSYGAATTDYSDDAPTGLSGHPYFVQVNEGSGHPSTAHNYEHGVYNSSTMEFTTNQLYTSSSSTNHYPDHRETIYTAQGGHVLPDGGDRYASLDGYQQVGSEYIPPLAEYVDIGSFICLYPSQSRKQTKIYHAGSLVQTENYIYTGSSDGTTGSISSGAEPMWSLLGKWRYYNDSLGRATNVSYVDVVTSQTRTLYSADYRGSGIVDGELLLAETDESGVTKTYQYDSLQRVIQMTVVGHGPQPDQITKFVYDANSAVLSQTTSSGSLSNSMSAQFDLAGRVVNQIDEHGVATQTSYSADGHVVTSTYPGGITVIKEQFPDRRQKSTTGSGVFSEFYTYNCFLDEIGFVMANQMTTYGEEGSGRWKNEAKDCYGLDAWQEQPAGGGTTNTIWSHKICYRDGWLSYLSSSQSNAITSYNYDNSSGNISAQQEQPFQPGIFGEEAFATTSLVQTPDPGGVPPIDFTQNRVTSSDSYVVQLNDVAYQATTNYVCLGDGDASRTIQSIHLQQLDGLTGTESGCSIDYDADLNETITTTNVDRSDNKITVTISKPNTSSQTATTIYQNGLIISASTLSVANPTVYSYDALGRTNMIQDPQGNFSLMTFDPSTGWLTSRTDPAGHKTSYVYYGPTEANSGKLKCQTDANGKKTYYSYTTQGELYQTWGDVPYPTEYRYNEFGDLTNLITFRGGNEWTGASWPTDLDYKTGDNTYWAYDPASGALLSKIDAQRQSVNYMYDTTTGRLLTRSWARMVNGANVTVTNNYNGFGDLVEQDYNDGTPSVQFNNYNRAGQAREIVDGAGTNELVYDNANRMVSSTYISGPLSGITVSNHFNPYFGRDALKVSSATGWNLEDDYGYDPYGRLGTVSSGACSATYGYVPNSDLLQSTTFKNGSTTVMATTRTWNFGFQLASIANTVDGTPVTSHAYQYDSVNCRTEATLEDGSSWYYVYNNRNELTSANRYWYDKAAVSGQQYGYGYDNIGNRTFATFGGDSNGNNLRTISYAANNLNQYTNILTPGLKDIIGATLATNSVTVSGGLADRHGEYFHRQISVLNTNQPVWQTVATSSGTFTNQGGLVFPANNQTLVYDADGNLTFDGVWNYQWDGENRLISMNMPNIASLSTNAQGLVTNRLRLDFVYDYLGRRIQKTVSVWCNSTSVFQPTMTNYFVYDGFNLNATLNPQFVPLQSFIWGNDSSGTMIKMCGVGGLLMETIGSTNCFTAFDGNGNITALVSASNGSLAARYEYNPYGELQRETGMLSQQNPFRFSTKFVDDESGLIYYNARYYDPNIGRWIGRDPTTDRVFLNLCLFCRNNPINLFDFDGREEVSLVGLLCTCAISGGIAGLTTGTIDGIFSDAYGKGFWSGFRKGCADGFVAGFVGAGVGVFGGGLGGMLMNSMEAQRVVGAMTATAVSGIVNLELHGHKLNGATGGLIFVTTMASGLFASAFDEAFSGYVVGKVNTPGSLFDKLTDAGLNADEIELDAAITAASEAGAGVADLTLNLMEMHSNGKNDNE